MLLSGLTLHENVARGIQGPTICQQASPKLQLITLACHIICPYLLGQLWLRLGQDLAGDPKHI